MCIVWLSYDFMIYVCVSCNCTFVCYEICCCYRACDKRRHAGLWLWYRGFLCGGHGGADDRGKTQAFLQGGRKQGTVAVLVRWWWCCQCILTNVNACYIYILICNSVISSAWHVAAYADVCQCTNLLPLILHNGMDETGVISWGRCRIAWWKRVGLTDNPKLLHFGRRPALVLRMSIASTWWMCLTLPRAQCLCVTWWHGTPQRPLFLG